MNILTTMKIHSEKIPLMRSLKTKIHSKLIPQKIPLKMILQTQTPMGDDPFEVTQTC